MLSSVFNAECEGEERILGNGDSTTISKLVVISQYTKYMGGVNKSDHYSESFAFLRKNCKMVEKDVFFGYLKWLSSTALFYTTLEGGNKTEKYHTLRVSKKFGRQLVGRIWKKNVRKRGRNSITEGSECLHGRQFIKKIPNSKAKNCAVCSDRKVKRIQTVYHCETCARQPGMHPDKLLQKVPH